MSELDHATKSAAKRVAQDVTAEIADRHVRARLRTEGYNRIVTLLDDVNRRHMRHTSRAVQRLVAAVIAGMVLGFFSAWALLG